MDVRARKMSIHNVNFFEVFANAFVPLLVVVTLAISFFYQNEKKEMMSQLKTQELTQYVIEPLVALWLFLCSGAAVICYLLARIFMKHIQSKEELVKYQDQLESLVEERTDELRIANRLLQRSEERAHLVKEIASAANADDNTEEVLLVAICSIAKNMQWPIGHVYIVSPENPSEMIPTSMWYLENRTAYQEFINITEKNCFGLGVGLPGTVLMEKKAILIEDVSKAANYPRSQVAMSVGLNAGFAFPIFVHGEVVAVLEFFAHKIEQLGEDVLSFAEEIGEQLALLMERKQGEEALRIEQDKAQGYLNIAGSVIVVIGADENVDLLNKAGEKLLGYHEDELVGKNWFMNVVPERVRKSIRTAFRRMINQEMELLEFYENLICLKDGTERLMSWHNVLIYDKNKKPIGVLASGEDITEQRKAEKELHKLSQAIEQSPVSVVITDREGRIQYVNPMFCEKTRYSFEEVIGKNPRVLKSGSLPSSFYQELWQTILSGKIWRGNFLNKTKEGNQYWERASISSIMDATGLITHFIAIKEDITEQKQMEEELLQAKVEAELSNKAKGDFLANMSHEIRTPMNAVIGLSHLALQTDLMPKQRDYLQKIAVSAQSLMKILDDILDFSKFASGKMVMENIDFDLCQVMEGVIAILNAKAEEKRLELVLNIADNVPVYLKGDQYRLKQILLNLLSNSLKFTDDGEVSLSIELIAQEANNVQLKFAVRDTGIGMSEQEQSRLFNPFTQADGSTTRKYGGTGLGLVICKQLAEMMGGAIYVKSAPDQGSEFAFTANFELYGEGQCRTVDPNPCLASDREEWKMLQGARILLVEDNEINLQVAKEIMQGRNITVIVARNGQEAVQLVQAMDFDGVLMDIQMPEMSGLEATELIRKDHLFIDLPIIAMTADVVPLRIQEYLAAGMNDAIAKPIHIEQMFQTICKWIKPQSIAADTIMKSASYTAEQQARGPLCSLKGINIEGGLARVGGNKKIYQKLLLQFLESHEETAKRWQRAVKIGDYLLLNESLHTFKSVAGNIGADHLYSAAKELEESIKGEETEKIALQMEQFSKQLCEVVESIREFADSSQQSTAPQTEVEDFNDFDQSKMLIKSLQINLANCDIEATVIFDQLKELSIAVIYQEEFKQIEIAINHYDFEKALYQLTQVVRSME